VLFLPASSKLPCIAPARSVRDISGPCSATRCRCGGEFRMRGHSGTWPGNSLPPMSFILFVAPPPERDLRLLMSTSLSCRVGSACTTRQHGVFGLPVSRRSDSWCSSELAEVLSSRDQNMVSFDRKEFLQRSRRRRRRDVVFRRKLNRDHIRPEIAKRGEQCSLHST
jgi:hypothetical protein